MDINDLKKLKKEIIDEIIPQLDGEMPPEERFSAYFAVAEAMGDMDSIKKSFDSAKLIEDSETRKNALMDLLELVSSIELSGSEDYNDEDENEN